MVQGKEIGKLSGLGKIRGRNQHKKLPIQFRCWNKMTKGGETPNLDFCFSDNWPQSEKSTKAEFFSVITSKHILPLVNRERAKHSIPPAP